MSNSNLIIALILIVHLHCVANAKSVQEVLDAGGCSTAAIGGLSHQLINNNTINASFSSIVGVSRLALGSPAQSVPYLQTSALSAILKAIDSNKENSTLTLNSALRTAPQQALLYEWFKQGKCGIDVASVPGTSDHESGLAIDTSDYNEWKQYLEEEGCKWYDSVDPVHFTCPGTTSKGDSVKAFQRLWNCNNPADQIPVNGEYDLQTRARVLKSPSEGFPNTCQ